VVFYDRTKTALASLSRVALVTNAVCIIFQSIAVAYAVGIFAYANRY